MTPPGGSCRSWPLGEPSRQGGGGLRGGGGSAGCLQSQQHTSGKTILWSGLIKHLLTPTFDAQRQQAAQNAEVELITLGNQLLRARHTMVHLAARYVVRMARTAQVYLNAAAALASAYNQAVGSLSRKRTGEAINQQAAKPSLKRPRIARSPRAPRKHHPPKMFVAHTET